MMRKVLARNLNLKRAYEAPAPANGRRVLVDRLWPRGLKKEAAALNRWAKDLAPSNEVRDERQPPQVASQRTVCLGLPQRLPWAIHERAGAAALLRNCLFD
jgi:hypothetical protein